MTLNRFLPRINSIIFIWPIVDADGRFMHNMLHVHIYKIFHVFEVISTSTMRNLFTTYEIPTYNILVGSPNFTFYPSPLEVTIN